MRIFCFALAIATITICALLFQHNAPAIVDWTNTLGVIAPIFFLLLYCLATILLLPTLMLTLAGGALFGPVIGTLFNLLGATLGAVCAFFISRYLAFDWVSAQNNVRLRKLITGVEGRGWQFVALLRLVPIIPFNLVNYGLGITRIKFSHYLITTIIFLIPAEILFTYCGFAGSDILIHPQTFYKSTNWLILCFLGVVSLIMYTLLKRYYRKAV